jgi:hypothetical protein
VLGLLLERVSSPRANKGPNARAPLLPNLAMEARLALHLVSKRLATRLAQHLRALTITMALSAPWALVIPTAVWQLKRAAPMRTSQAIALLVLRTFVWIKLYTRPPRASCRATTLNGQRGAIRAFVPPPETTRVATIKRARAASTLFAHRTLCVNPWKR